MSSKKKTVVACVITCVATVILTVGTIFYLGGRDGFDYLKFQQVKSIIDSEFIYEHDGERMTDYAISGMVSSLDDPYSIYYDKESFESRMSDFSGNYVGIGVTMLYPEEEAYPVIQEVYEGSTAETAGIQKEDKLVAVDGTEFTHDNYNDLIDYTKGTHLDDPIGTAITVTIERNGNRLDLTVERGDIKTTKVDYRMVGDGIGYLRVAKFDENTVPGIETAMEAMYGEGMESLIFDLRGCPGGDLESVCAAADIFLDKGVIVYMEDKKGNRTYRYSDEEQDTIPMVILIDGNSASASEVFTGAMRDRERATIVGVTSFGKGIVQSLITLPDGSGLSITTEQYFSPNGINIHGVGIEPDVRIELSEEAQNKTIPQLTLEEDTQLQGAIRILSETGEQ